MKKFQAFKLTRKEMKNVVGGAGYPIDEKIDDKWCEEYWSGDQPGIDNCKDKLKKRKEEAAKIEDAG